MSKLPTITFSNPGMSPITAVLRDLNGALHALVLSIELSLLRHAPATITITHPTLPAISLAYDGMSWEITAIRPASPAGPNDPDARGNSK